MLMITLAAETPEFYHSFYFCTLNLKSGDLTLLQCLPTLLPPDTSASLALTLKQTNE